MASMRTAARVVLHDFARALTAAAIAGVTLIVQTILRAAGPRGGRPAPFRTPPGPLGLRGTCRLYCARPGIPQDLSSLADPAEVIVLVCAEHNQATRALEIASVWLLDVLNVLASQQDAALRRLERIAVMRGEAVVAALPQPHGRAFVISIADLDHEILNGRDFV